MTLGSLALGLTVSAVRWMLVDTLHHATGVHPPAWEFALARQIYTVLPPNVIPVYPTGWVSSRVQDSNTRPLRCPEKSSILSQPVIPNMRAIALRVGFE